MPLFCRGLDKFCCTPARTIPYLSPKSPKHRALSQPPESIPSWQLLGICWLSPRFSIQTLFPVPNPNRWRGKNWGTLQLPGLTATLPASAGTQWRAAGRNQKGQDTLLMFMRVPVMYKKNRTEHQKQMNPSFTLYIKVDRKDTVYF